ncbi:MAG: hypothetical protein ACHQF0_10235 [Chitinophagales bacterium]
MLKLSTLFFLSAFLFSCSSNNEPKNNDAVKDTTNKNQTDTSSLNTTGYYKIEGDSLEIPSFKIEVSLSQKANEKLKKGNETIIVWAYFSGIPKDTTLKEYLKSGGMSIASTQQELSGENRTAEIEGVRFSKSLYDSLADKDIQVLINIYSGRKSSRDNLLDCDILEEKMSVVKGKEFTLKGKLIGEK